VVLELAELTTFGAVLGFAMDTESQAEKFYEEAAKNPSCSEAKETLLTLSEQARRRGMILERTRRENVAEMILEPISGLNTNDYLTHIAPSERAGCVDVLTLCVELQRKTRRFYLDSSGRISLQEVARTFRRLAEEVAEGETELRALLDKTTPR